MRTTQDLLNFIKLARSFRGYKTAHSFCKASKLNYEYYRQVEKGVKKPSLPYLIKVLDKLDCKLTATLN